MYFTQSPSPAASHRCSAKEGARRAACMALDMVDWTAAFVNPSDARKLRVRLGINTGECGIRCQKCGSDVDRDGRASELQAIRTPQHRH